MIQAFKEMFSFSKLNTFSCCPRKYWYRYILGRRESSAAQIYGRAVHFGQEVDCYNKLEGRRLPRATILDAAVDKLKEEADKERVRPDTDTFVKEHERQLEVFEESGERDRINPVAGTVEAPFEMRVSVGNPETGEKEAEATIQGFVDVVSQNPRTGEKTIVDYKTAVKPVYPKMADDNLQFGLYILGAPADSLKVVNFVKSGKQKPTTKVTRPTVMSEPRRTKLMTWLSDTIKSVRRAIRTGDWPRCSPTCHWCSPNACDFHGLCYPDKDTDLPKLIQIEEIRPVGTVERPAWRK
jgi:CRISPR/Cas system-associated exonuclease Cas4 (RecB family)